MRFAEFAVTESSGYSFKGSWTPDLVASKTWLIRELNSISPSIDTMYVLGAWYSNLAIMIARLGFPQVNKIINVETDPRFLKHSKKILDNMGVDNVQYMLSDANDLDYRQLDDHGVVVNTSLTDMAGRDWFDNIPRGTVIALQARDHDPGEKFDSPESIQRKFPLNRVLYSGSQDLKDPETSYTRFMVIGVK